MALLPLSAATQRESAAVTSAGCFYGEVSRRFTRNDRSSSASSPLASARVIIRRLGNSASRLRPRVERFEPTAIRMQSYSTTRIQNC
jgi:hypothetical protein